MSNRAPVSFLEALQLPLYRDWPIFLFGTIFFFLIQFTGSFLMKRYSPKFRRLSKEDQDTWSVRLVASVNSLLCAATAYRYLTQGQYLDDLYDSIPGQTFSTSLLASYFVYDVIVCHFYAWGFLYTSHGYYCLTMCVLASYPATEKYHGMMTGMFELTNIFLHVPEMLAMLENTAPTLQLVLKGIFSFLFLAIRPVWGTMQTLRFFSEVFELYKGNFEGCHNGLVLIIIASGVAAVMLLQYMFTKTVIHGILATFGLASMEGVGDAKSPTNSKKGKNDEFPSVPQKFD